MEFLDLAATLLVLAAAFGYLNLKIFKLPTTIGIMLIGLLLSVVVLVLRRWQLSRCQVLTAPAPLHQRSALQTTNDLPPSLASGGW